MDHHHPQRFTFQSSMSNEIDEISHQITRIQLDQEMKKRKDLIARRIILHNSIAEIEKRRRLQRASEQKAFFLFNQRKKRLDKAGRLQRASEQKAFFLFNQRKKRLEKAYRLRREYLMKEICKPYLLFFWVEIRLPYQGLTFVIHCPGLFFQNKF